MNRPTSVQLVVAVHGVAAAESDEHGLGTAGDAEHFMAENEGIGLCEGGKGPVTVFDDFANQRLSDFVGGATDLWAFWHGEKQRSEGTQEVVWKKGLPRPNIHH